MDAAGAKPNECRCPECGVAVGSDIRTLLRGSRPSRVIPLLAAFIVAIVLVAMFWQGSQSASSAPIAPGRYETKLVMPLFRLADLAQIAGGKRETNGELCRAVMATSNDWHVRPPGDELLSVASGALQGWRYDTTSYGWPFPWLIVASTTAYNNIATRAERDDSILESIYPTDRTPGFTTDWFGGQILVYTNQQNLADQYRIPLLAISAFVATLVIGWYLARLLVILAMRLRSTNRRADSKVAARLAALGVLVLFAALIGATLIFPKNESSYWTNNYAGLNAATFTELSQRLYQRSERLPITYRQIAEWSVLPDGDQRLAKSLGVDIASGGAEMLLSASFTENTVRSADETYVSWPFSLYRMSRIQRWYVDLDDSKQFSSGAAAMTGGFRYPSGGPISTAGLEQAQWPARTFVVRLWGDELQIAFPRFGQSTTLYAHVINIPGVLTCALAIWTAWWVTRAACVGTAYRRMKKHAAANCCVNCGYSLAALPSAPTPPITP